MHNNFDINSGGFVRLKDIIAPRGPVPFSKSKIWANVKSGRFPKPVKFGPRITAWRKRDIIDFLERGGV